MGIGSLVGGVVGFMVGGPPGAAIGAGAGSTKAGEAVVNAAGNVVKEAADFTVEVVEGFGEIMWKGGTAIIDCIGDIAKGAYNVVHGTTAFRSLRPSELQVLRPVYGGSVPYDDVVLCSLIGLENRPLCLPGSMLTMKAFMIPGIGPAMTIYALARRLHEKYVLLVGMDGYNRGLNMPFDTTRGGQTLVHEMMHVWQGHNRAWQWEYVYDSVLSQCTCSIKGTDAYNATAGLPKFSDYMVEQQARLIENWYCGEGANRRIKDRTIPNPAAMQILNLYMDEIIRPGRPHGTVTIPVTGMIGTTSSTLTVATDAKLGSFSGGVSAGGSRTGALAVAPPPTALTDAQMAQFRAMAEQLTQQARIYKTSGNAYLIAQAQMMEAQAAQFRQLGGMTYQPSGQSATATSNAGSFLRR